MPRGGPYKLEAERTRSSILDAVRAGCPPSVACGYGGIARSTWHEWKRRGEHHRADGVDSVYSRFVTDIEQAEAESIAQATFVLRSGMVTDWKAALEFLKRRCPHEWSDRVEVHRRHEGAQVRAELAPDRQREIALALLAD